MDIFRINTPAGTGAGGVVSFGPGGSTLAPTNAGQIINNIKSKLWIERYSVPGEFKLVAPIYTGIIEKLPIGSFISHIHTQEVMMVLDHQITEDQDKPTDISITGKSLPLILNNRIVGANKDFSTLAIPTNYIADGKNSWGQIQDLIEFHIRPEHQIDPGNIIPDITVITQVTGGGTVADRSIKIGSLFDRVQELLTVDGLGIKTMRPSFNTSIAYGTSDTILSIYKGINKTSDIVFTNIYGEIESADYFWSIQDSFTGAYVHGKWCDVFVENESGSSGLNRRVIDIDAADIDNELETNPVGATRTWIEAAMTQRGREAIAAQKEIILTKAQPNENTKQYVYRSDYNLGDLVTVFGNYGQKSTMQIVEHVEIEDDRGESGHPTLAYPDEEN